MALYIDAGTGGMMLQVLLTGIVGGLVFLKLAARRIVDFVLRRHHDATTDDATTIASEEDTDDSLAA